MTYNEFIQNILDTRGRFSCGDEYHERHHILPKCMGGTNDEENLIDLYAKEHFIAHKLLSEENTDNYSLQYAFWNMCQINGNSEQERYTPTAEEYENARIICSKISSEVNTGELHPMYGKHHSQETKEKMSNSHKGLHNGADNPMYGTHHTDEWKEQYSKKMKEWHKNTRHPMARYLYCDGIIFDTLKECAKYYGVDSSTIRKWIIGTCKMPKRFVDMGLRYYNEKEWV